jgi:hypothetical protein
LRGKREKGQALAELVIVLPLFLALLGAIAFWAHLMLARLALIQLTRDYALLLARNPELLHAEQPEQTLQLQALARRISWLQAEHLDQRLEALPPSLTQKTDPDLASGMALPGVGGLLQGMLLGQRLWVGYRLHFDGLAGRLFPQGIEMKETVAFKGDPWNNPIDRIMDALRASFSRLLGT